MKLCQRQVNPPASQRSTSAATGPPPASPRNVNPPPSSVGGSSTSGSPAVVPEAAQPTAGNVSVGEQEEAVRKQTEGDESDEGDEGDEGDEEEQEEEEEEEDDDEEQSDYDGEGAGSEDAAEEEEHDLEVVDLSENADKVVVPSASQRADLQAEQQALQGIIDNVASFSVGSEQPAEEQDEAREEGVSVAAVAVLTDAERGVRTAKALAEAAAMQELSSKLFPLLVERLPQVLGQDTAESPQGKLSLTNDTCNCQWAQSQ